MEVMNQEIFNLKQQISIARNELKNIRGKVVALKNLHQLYVEQIENAFGESKEKPSLLIASGSGKAIPQSCTVTDQLFDIKPIGYINSSFKCKNGTPRQSSICLHASASLELNKSFFTNPNHALDGLQDFSHIWLIFIFHKNDKQSYNKGKVSPPRLDGKRIGVFSTRSPHRPNAIGLSLAQLIKIDGDTLYLSGIDVLDGTPVVDIKPYIPAYDQPKLPLEHEDEIEQSREAESLAIVDNQNTDKYEKPHQEIKCDTDYTNASVPSWISCPPVKQLSVHWTTRAIKCLNAALAKEANETYKIITNILQEDPRSVYRRQHCKDQLYYFTFSALHLTCWFDDSDSSVEVVKVCSK